MNAASRFRDAPGALPASVRLDFDGTPLLARLGESVAAAILAHTAGPTRRTATDAPRTPYCMMGVCFECLMEIDGMPNQQACMIQVRDGMSVRSQSRPDQSSQPSEAARGRA